MLQVGWNKSSNKFVSIFHSLKNCIKIPVYLETWTNNYLLICIRGPDRVVCCHIFSHDCVFVHVFFFSTCHYCNVITYNLYMLHNALAKAKQPKVKWVSCSQFFPQTPFSTAQYTLCGCDWLRDSLEIDRGVQRDCHGILYEYCYSKLIVTNCSAFQTDGFFAIWVRIGGSRLYLY